MFEYENADVTPRMLYALQVWKDQGRRAVDIKMDLNRATVWVFDYDAGHGKFVYTVQDLPDMQELLELERKAQLDRRKHLEEQLAALEVSP